VLSCLEIFYKNCLCSTMDGEYCRVKEEQLLVKIRGTLQGERGAAVVLGCLELSYISESERVDCGFGVGVEV
jgi:hypothetical protein